MAELDYSQSPNSRFQVYPSPVASPGKCGVCGAVDRPVVDFNMTIQFYGAVYICVTCMNEAARVINLVPQELLDEANERLTQSFEFELAQRDLVVIPNEQYQSIALALGNISGIVLSVNAGNTSTVAEPAVEAEPSIFDFDEFKPEVDGGTPKQEHDVIVSQGWDSLPASNGDGVPAKFSL